MAGPFHPLILIRSLQSAIIDSIPLDHAASLVLTARFGSSRWKIEWHWADAGTVTQSTGKASRAKMVVPAKKSRHSLAYWVHLKAAKLRKAARRAAKKLAAAKRAAARRAKQMLVAARRAAKKLAAAQRAAARRAKQRLAAARRAAAIIAAAKRQGRKLLAEELPSQKLSASA